MKLKQGDLKWMQLALEEAGKDRRIYQVGAVVIKDGQLIGQAHGDIESGEHAEAKALCALQDVDLRGATVYTTLEPCIHVRGERATDCAVKLIERGVSEVVVGMSDPDERVCGRGWQYLKERNVTVRRFSNDLKVKVFDMNFKFIEKMSVAGNAITWKPKVEYTRMRGGEQGKRRRPLGFVDDFKPDIADVMALVNWYGRHPIIPRIVWSPVVEALWRNVLLERLRILEDLRTGTDRDLSINSKEENLEFVTRVISFAWRIRAGAAERIPKMWRGMTATWGAQRADAFKDALVSFLVICSLYLLRALHGAQRQEVPDLFPRGKHWRDMVSAKNTWLTDVYKDVFDSQTLFFVLTVSGLGDWRPQPDLDIYAPRPAVLELGQEGHKVERVPLIYRQYVIPQVEYDLIGQSRVVDYKTIEWRRILDDRGNEVSSFVLI